MSSSSLWVDPESWLATPMLLLEMIWLEHGITQNSFISPHPWDPETWGRGGQIRRGSVEIG